MVLASQERNINYGHQNNPRGSMYCPQTRTMHRGAALHRSAHIQSCGTIPIRSTPVMCTGVPFMADMPLPDTPSFTPGGAPKSCLSRHTPFWGTPHPADRSDTKHHRQQADPAPPPQSSKRQAARTAAAPAAERGARRRPSGANGKLGEPGHPQRVRAAHQGRG